VLVVGSPNSSNSNRLKEVAERLGATAYLIDNAKQIQREWLEGKHRIGLSAGASAPEILVSEVLEQLHAWGVELGKESITRREKVVFSLPRELQA
jgi:4-hydroxy-3-methylbut-2-enyl diphosphate reductase